MLPFFPFPYILDGERYPGYQFSWPKRCDNCDRQCQRSSATAIATCSYGVNFVWLGSNLLIFGFLVKGSSASSAQKKMFRSNPDHFVTVPEIELAAKVYEASGTEFIREVQLRKSAIIADYESEKKYEADFLDNLKPQIQRNFSFVHDYKQFIARIRQNINVVIEARYGGTDFNEKLVRALPAERAIYWASILMEEKLKTAFLLMNPERITDTHELKIFRLHGAVLKYIRIYNSAFKEKNVNLIVSGDSIGEIMGNPIAVPVIPHTLLDNALKYSKRNSEVRIEFNETDQQIELSVVSHGPKIADEELDKIFDLFYRGKSARDQEEEGSGFGLYLAQFIAITMGTKINVQQVATSSQYGYKTTFSIRFLRAR